MATFILGILLGGLVTLVCISAVMMGSEVDRQEEKRMEEKHGNNG